MMNDWGGAVFFRSTTKIYFFLPDIGEDSLLAIAIDE